MCVVWWLDLPRRPQHVGGWASRQPTSSQATNSRHGFQSIEPMGCQPNAQQKHSPEKFSFSLSSCRPRCSCYISVKHLRSLCKNRLTCSRFLCTVVSRWVNSLFYFCFRAHFEQYKFLLPFIHCIHAHISRMGGRLTPAPLCANTRSNTRSNCKIVTAVPFSLPNF